MKSFRLIPAIVAAAMLVGCVPSDKKETELTQETQQKEKAETTIIPSIQIDESYYKTLIPYKESASRGLVVSNIYTKYDMKEVESGLMRLSQNEFDTDNYYFQEGQYLAESTVSSWLARSSQTEDGLNPPTTDTMTPEERATKAPVYLSHIVEQNYLTKTNDNKVKLGGISIGLALNSIYYYQKEQYGEYYEKPISESTLIEQGKKMAAEIVSRLRSREELKDVPIVVGLFKQQARNQIIPGTYFSYGVAKAGQNSIADWEGIDENYVLFPTDDSQDVYRDINNNFKNFKQDVDKYFSNYTSVIGTGFYRNKQIQNLSIEIPIQFFGKAEIIGFTQYLTGILINQFDNIHVEVSVTSVNGPEALIIKKANDKDPYVHVYD
ncbi:CamS family sex pheromone protein [Lysinibacillus sp. OL1_EC]|uniref:CamS family sex pheromone protein n=1 Tax=unclassified Lysinibacillus TaxID=2636778 RepID=UPI00103D75B1|nr:MULTISPECIES: CamS family sex pheromone protein [unclassified Lysinibacillus]MCM0626630.1 CamS family sex pheromone protein [Lysinibacillus sp. OL1_EC]MCS5503546.1 CamS family sex pheromone protein [Lysinibacillus sp. A4]TBV85894.1 CamS family sex pheromone protein [Lysinibacillus sp. OL1]UKJ44934.1 CamS family sex pheromone protein [Lysinibacillus sp. ACHW1.5]WGT38353.1 CamS family sex pheromone protein [Lysinibacillus sp. 1 U-2021]